LWGGEEKGDQRQMERVGGVEGVMETEAVR
jgi:hypothetical protein